MQVIKNNLKYAGLFISLFVLSGCIGGDVITGQISGDIEYQSVSAEVASYYSSTIPAPVCTAPPVQASLISQNSLTATTVYTPANATLFPKVASYEVHPSVDIVGSSFRLQVDRMCFANGSTYRFGKHMASSTGQVLTGTVFREITDSNGVVVNGVTVNIAECPAMVHANLRLTGDNTTLDGITDPITCWVKAGVMESGIFLQQALSTTEILPSSDLKNLGTDLPIIVRGDGSEVLLNAGCTLTTTIPGFPFDPATGDVKVAGISEPNIVSCGDSINIDVPIPVDRTAGVLEGWIGLGPSLPDTFRVELPELNWHTSNDVGGSGSPYQWRFDAVSAGHYNVIGKTLFNNNKIYLEFPHLIAPFDPEVIFDEITELGSTFVSQPALLNGSVSLRDKRNNSSLSQLFTGPIESFLTHSPNSTYIQVRGVPGIYVDESANLGGNGGGNGDGGLAQSVLTGNFDTTSKQADLQYSVPIVGLSPPTAPLNGLGALPTVWAVDGFNVFVGDPYVAWSRVFVKPLQLIQRISTPNTVYNNIPSLDICVGEVAFNFVNATPGNNLYNPYIYIYDSTIQSPVDDLGAPILYTADFGRAAGIPRTQSSAQTSATVKLTLPAYLSYGIRPRISVVPSSGGAPTHTFLPSRTFPENDLIECGSYREECTALANGEEFSSLSVSITSTPQFCISDGLPIDITAESGTGSIAKMTIQLDSNTPIVLCAPCSSPYTTTYPLNIVTAGSHSIKVTGTDNVGCTAIKEEQIEIVADPVLNCPSDIGRILWPGQNSLPFADISSKLSADWTSTCSLNQPLIGDNHPSHFQIGETIVNFYPLDSSGNPIMSESCSTKVVVKPPNGCDSYEGVPIGPLPDSNVWTHDRVTYTNIAGTALLRITDQEPHALFGGSGGDGVGELDFAQAVRISLPFPAGWVEIQHYVDHPAPVIIKGFDSDGNEVASFQSPSGQDESKRLYDQITGAGIKTVEVSGASGELALHAVVEKSVYR